MTRNRLDDKKRKKEVVAQGYCSVRCSSEPLDTCLEPVQFAGESIDKIVTTGVGGYWDFSKSYSFNKNSPVYPANLTICEVVRADWYQTYPEGDPCYHVTLDPAGIAYADNLIFGNWGIGIPRW
jgi:hypothetical protein